MSIENFDKWNDLKKKIDNKNMDNIYFKEWDIWWLSLWKNIKNEAYWKWENFMRPVLIFKKLSRDSFIWIPLSSKDKTWTWFQKYTLHWLENTALLYQIRMFNKNRLQRKIWELNSDDFDKIKESLAKLLELS